MIVTDAPFSLSCFSTIILEKLLKFSSLVGYLACARCSATGLQVSNIVNGKGLESERCSVCSGTAKVNSSTELFVNSCIIFC